MDKFLKGNFTVKHSIDQKDTDKTEDKKTLTEKLKKRALASLGGSMVYIERTELTWHGDE